MKKAISLLLAIVFVISMIPTTALTAQAASAGDTVTYTFSNYTAGTQYGDNEVHELDETVTVTTTDVHFTQQLRLYHGYPNGVATFQSQLPIETMVFNAGYKNNASFDVSVSDDGTTWTKLQTVTTTSTSYLDYTVEIGGATYVKLHNPATAQTRIATVTITFGEGSGEPSEPSCAHTNTVAIGEAVTPTCQTTGMTAGSQCADCGEVLEAQKELPIVDHTYENGACSVCGAEEPDGYNKTNSIAVGDVVVLVYEGANMELSAISTSSTKYGLGVAFSGQPVGVMPLTVVAGNAEGSFAFQNGSNYLYWTSGNSLNVDASLSENTSWNVSFDADGNAVITNVADATRIIRWNTGSPRFACYTSGQAAVQLYKLSGNATVCNHENTAEDDNAVAATCFTTGLSASISCADCGIELEAQVVTPALGHNYVNGICSGCNAAEAEGYSKATTVAVGDTVVLAGESASGNFELLAVGSYGTASEYVYSPLVLMALTVEAGASEGTVAFKNGDAYLSWISGNTLATASEVNANSSWIVTFDEDGNAVITNAADSTRLLQWNASSPRFACYTGSQAAIQLYKLNTAVVNEHDLTYYAAVEANCHQNGMAEYWYCAECDCVFADEAATIVTNRMNLTIPYTAEIAHVEAVEANCHQNGNVEYWYCTECEAVFTDAALTQLSNFKSVITPATVGLTHVEAVEAGLHTKGCAEYWYCAECDCVFADAAATMLTNRKNLVIVAEHELAYVEAVEAGLHQPGVAEYWYCDDCDAFFADADGIVLTNYKNLINGSAEHPLTYIAAVEATCHQPGMAEYWYCEICDAYFADANGIQLTNAKNLITEPAAPLTYVAAVEAGLHTKGCAEYWYCEECMAVFTDAQGTQLTNLKNLVIVAEHELAYVEAVQAGLHQNGVAEYWYCDDCDAFFADADGIYQTNYKNLINGSAEHPLTYVAAVEAGLHQNGVAEYWYCEICDTIFADANGIQVTNYKNLINGSAEHPLTYVAAVEATCHQPGMAEYWYCAECDAFFADPNGIQLTNAKNLITEPAAPLTYVPAVEPTLESNGHYEYWYCETCEAVFADAQGTILTNIKNLTIPMLTGIVINTQPADISGEVGDVLTVTVDASGADLQYVWYYSTNGNAWYKSSFTGKNTNTLTVPVTAARDGFLYRCVITDAEGNKVTSEAAALTVTSDPVEDQVATVGQVVTFHAGEFENVKSFKWQYSTNGGKSWYKSTFAGCNTADMDVVATAARDGFMYRCVITLENGEVITTEAATLIINGTYALILR